MAMQTVTTTIESVIWVAPNRQGGEPCFINTGVPIKTLFEYLAEGEPLDDFLRGFPTITREQAEAVLDLAKTYFVGLLREQAREQETSHLKQLIADGINSGEPTEMTPADWDEIEAEVIQMASKSSASSTGSETFQLS